MDRPRLPLPLRAALLVLAALLGGCDEPASVAPGALTIEQVEDRLHGSWLREHSAAGIRSRRVLALQPQGLFRERVRLVDERGAVTEHVHEGTWLYDGTNLKRKYTRVNGEPPSRLRPPFVTFQIEFESRNAFVGIDHVHRNRVHYRRVAPDTAP